MSGISSKAASTAPENNYKYNGLELENSFDINIGETFFRTHDPQLGRWWQIDPKPNHFESPFVCMGNNPILNMDFMGDTLRGTNGTSAQRTLDLIQQTLGAVKGTEALSKLFSIGSDGVSFNSIDGDAFKAALGGIDNYDLQSLAQGYCDVVNATETHFVDVINSEKGEKPDLSEAKNMNAGFKNSKNVQDLVSTFKTGGNATMIIPDGQSLTLVDMTNTKPITGVVNNKGEAFNFLPGGAFILAHELLGHNLSAYNNGSASNAERVTAMSQDAIKVNNAIFRIDGRGFRDTGASHNSPKGKPMTVNISNIPYFLQPRF